MNMFDFQLKFLWTKGSIDKKTSIVSDNDQAYF